jgi:hypothetical protein
MSAGYTVRMDEIVIEDKKYISTKRAAKATGYAKDYVGQLCREGRVPARLVGRSWYVLESALADHRFGNEGAGEEKKSEYPKYQADEIEMIETLTQEKVVAPTVEVAVEKPERETIKDAWEAWFDRVAKATVRSEPAKEESADEGQTFINKEEEGVAVHISREERVAIHAVESREEAKEEEGSTDDETNEVVPVRHVSHTKRTFLPEEKGKSTSPRHSPASSVLISAKIGGGLVALFFIVALVLSTGFFDTTLISDERDASLAGISVYKK